MKNRSFLVLMFVLVFLIVFCVKNKKEGFQNVIHRGFRNPFMNPLCNVFSDDRHVNQYACGCRYPGNTGCLSTPTRSRKTSNKLQSIFSSCAHCSPGNNCYYGSYVGNHAPHKKPLKYRCAYCKNRRYCSWQ